MTIYVIGDCKREIRDLYNNKRKANYNIANFSTEWLGVKPRDTLLTDIKRIITADEWRLLYDYYFYGYKQQELCNKYNISQVQISRRLNKIYEKIRGVIAC